MRELEVALEELQQLKDIITLMPGNVYWKDCDGKYLGCNDNQRIVAGLSSIADIIGKTDYDLYEYALADQVRREDAHVIETGIPSLIEEKGVDVDGNKAIYLTKKMPFFYSQRKLVGVIGVSLNITAQKAAEEREKLSIASEAEARGEAKAEAQMRQAVTVLTGSIVHDLRTPLMVFKANARYLKQNVPALFSEQASSSKNEMQLKNVMEALDDLESSAKQMGTFIDSTLKMLSKTTVGKFDKEDLTPCFINKCISYTLDSYPFSKEERLLVEWNRSDDYCFMGNEVLFVRILYNLIKNALYQISKNQRGKIIITTECGAESNILRFRDTAGGAEPAVVDRLFQGYETTKTGGTGVGLAYCQQVMTSFGGQISCHSEYGDYIEFVMTFPVA